MPRRSPVGRRWAGENFLQINPPFPPFFSRSGGSRIRLGSGSFNILLAVSEHHLRMAHEEEFEMSLGRPAEGGSLRILEVVGVLLAVVPCGILAGLYLVSEDIKFLIACAFFAMVAIVVVFWRRPSQGRGRRRAHPMRYAATPGRAKADRPERAAGRLAGIRRLGADLQGRLTKRAMKIAGFLVWMAAWIFTAVMFARVAENENVTSLAIFVMIGSLSPLIFYFLLETGVNRLSGRLRDED